MKKYILILIIFIIHTNLQAQQPTRIRPIENLSLPQGYVLESISGTGFTKSVCNHTSNISSSNPAGLYDVKSILFGISYQFESSIEPAWFSNINHKRDENSLPQSCGLVLPFQKLRVGLAFRQLYNSVLSYRKIIETVAPNPEAFLTTHVNSYSILFSYPFEKLLTGSDVLIFGIQGNYDRLDVTKQVLQTKETGNEDDLTWALGIRYDFSEQLLFGLYYEKGPLFKGRIEYNYIDLVVVVDNTITGNNDRRIDASLPVFYSFEDRLPDKLNLGALYKMNSFMNIAFDITHIYWNQVSEFSKNYIDFSGTVTGDILNELSLSLGFLSTDHNYETGSNLYFMTDGKLNSVYLLVGINYRIRNFYVDFAYVTNSIETGDWREQDIGKISVGFSL